MRSNDYGEGEGAVGHFSVLYKFKNVGDQFEWAFIGVYGPNSNKKRKKNVGETDRVVSYTRAMYGFSNFISLHGLMDIPMKGGLYTWSNTSSTCRIE